MIDSYTRYLKPADRQKIENRYTQEKRRQRGVEFPSPIKQEHLFIIRFNISDCISVSKDGGLEAVRFGLRDLCTFFDKLDAGIKKIDFLSNDGTMNPVPLSNFNFSFTIGFGSGFFKKLDISEKNRPKNLKNISPYTLQQTDFIIQLGANNDFVNRWVFQNRTGIAKKNGVSKGSGYTNQLRRNISEIRDEDPSDIYTAIKNWATITDIHAGFQRIDGKNLLGFNDGISNPVRFLNDVIWTNKNDESVKFQDATYMVFQKIGHDLEMWQNMDEEKQERWIGRSKATGLLLGTLSRVEDRKLGTDLHSNNEFTRHVAKKKWKKLYDQQKDPERKLFDPTETQFKGIQLECPIWSHVRKANPRQADGAAKSFIFRRGYLYVEGDTDGRSSSGLLFVCFQRNIKNGFEYIKKNFLNNKNFPVPQQRKNLNAIELQKRRQEGLLIISKSHMTNSRYGTTPNSLDIENTGKDGLSGPSELGVFHEGQPPITLTHGGGYYFIPPIPKKRISDISEQFFV